MYRLRAFIGGKSGTIAWTDFPEREQAEERLKEYPESYQKRCKILEV